jgi:type IV secretory pathway TraG/TraD family ATPase VirD4
MDAPLLHLSPLPEDSYRLADAFEGVAIFGRSGSGKTSGSGQALAKAYLRSGFGGVVLCAKPDEADNWERYAAETGRSASVIRFDGSGRWRFNFLEYEMQRSNLPRDVLTANLVSTLQSVIEVAGRATGLSANAGSGDQFWQKSSRMFLTMAVDFLYAATGQVRLAELVELLNSAPTSKAQMSDPDWQRSSFFAQTFQAFYATGGVYPPDPEEAKRLAGFWQNTFPNMTEKTRSNILATLFTDLDPLLRGRMREIFSTSSNVVPELTHDGAIILLDFPLKSWNETGVLAQMIFKYLWMRATERRDITDQTRPVFLWGDEAQLFTSSYDMEFQSTARSSRASTVLLTQNLPSFYSRIGGPNPEHTVNAMMGNLRTKIFHNNDDTTTNEWATELIGKETVWRQSFGQNVGWSQDENESHSQGQSTSRNIGVNAGAGKSWNTTASKDNNWSYSIGYNRNVGSSSGDSYSDERGMSRGRSQGQSGGRTYGMSEERDYAVEPSDFATDLLTGGPSFNNLVTGVMVLPGRRFRRNGKHWMQITFPQRSGA